jgi:hypothetical protein
MDLRLRGGHGPFVLEKWYVDTLAEDGTVLLVYLGWMRVFGAPMARVTAELFPPDGHVVRGDAKVDRIEAQVDRLRFGPAELGPASLRFDTPGLRGDLRFEARRPEVALKEPFVTAGRRSLRWDVEVPDADVSGTLEWPGMRRELTGRGYRDRVWFDLLPWRFPIRELHWGRAASRSHATTWVRALARGAEVAASWTDGEVREGAVVPELGPSRVIADTHVVDLEGLRLGALRPLFRSLTGDPHEVKRAGPAVLGGEAAASIHEVVTWNRTANARKSCRESTP